MKKTLLCVLGLSLYFLSSVGAQNISSSDESYKSVVQVIAYGDIYGKYPVLRGWGSASIISKDGLILTNNHVVSNEQGNAQSAFSVCLSSTTTSRPICNRTASLIAKDEKKDIALLRIDPTDIDGAKVDYALFHVSSLDYTYSPNPQDKVLAIGYPWVGADTITQTVGVVAGTQVYNDQTYIKTDTLIAPGNSGGPLLKDGKVIGVNTFGIGDGQSLGYALQISQAKNFIDTNSSKEPSSSKLSIAHFQKYLASSNDISLKKEVSDSVFKIKLPKSYVITNYIPNNQIQGKIQSSDDTSIQEFSISAIQVSSMSSYDDFVYTLKLRYGYDPSYLKLIKKTIGGMAFYQLVSADDVSQGDSSSYKIYIGQYDNNTIVELFLATPPLDDQTKQKTVKANIDSFLAGIQFTIGYVAPTIPSVQFVIPPLQLNIVAGMKYNIVDSQTSFFESSAPFATLTLSKPHEVVNYYLKSNSIDEGNSQTLAQKFKTATERIPSNQKTLLSYNGNVGYGYCNKDGEGSWGDSVVTKQGARVEMGLCRIVLYLGKDQEYILTIDMKVEKNSLEKKQKDFISIITNTIVPEKTGDGKSSLPKTIMKNKSPGFADAKDQSTDYNNYLDLLVQYGIIKKGASAGLEDPLTYKDYLALYLKSVYNIKKDMSDKVLEQTGIRGYSYMDESKYDLLNTLIRLRMAGISLPDYSDKTIQLFSDLADSTYRTQREKIEAFEYKIFQGDKFGIDKLGFQSYASYKAYSQRYYEPIFGIIKQNNYNTVGSLSTPLLNNINQATEKKIISCGSKPAMDKNCIKLYKQVALQQLKPGYGAYTILMRGSALAHLSSEIDISLFDVSWAEKKMSGGNSE